MLGCLDEHPLDVCLVGGVGGDGDRLSTSPWIISAVARARTRSRSAHATVAPSRASSRLIARPFPGRRAVVPAPDSS